MGKNGLAMLTMDPAVGALANFEKVLGPEHPNVNQTLENYAVLLRNFWGTLYSLDASTRYVLESGPWPREH